jgi:hypothetical protein
MSVPTEYGTDELGAAALALARGHALRRIDGPPGGRRRFVFDADAGPVVESYLAGATVSAVQFTQCLARLKGLLRRS